MKKIKINMIDRRFVEFETDESIKDMVECEWMSISDSIMINVKNITSIQIEEVK